MKNTIKVSIFFIACIQSINCGNISSAESYEAYYGINYQKKFFDACKTFKQKEAEKYLNKGADINAIANKEENQNILSYIISKNYLVSKPLEEMVKFLVNAQDEKIDINAKDNKGFTALEKAAVFSPYNQPDGTEIAIEILNNLLSRKDIEVNTQDKLHDGTPLIAAAYSGFLDGVTILLNRGANKNIISNAYGTALNAAKIAMQYQTDPKVIEIYRKIIALLEKPAQ